jgi:putative DNA primase/helicase
MSTTTNKYTQPPDKSPQPGVAALTTAYFDYLSLGWSVFPLLPKSKLPNPDLLRLVEGKPSWKPFTTEPPGHYQCSQWANAEPNGNIAIATGGCSGVFVWECDNLAGVEFTEEQGVPHTLRARTRPNDLGRVHYLFRVPDGIEIGNKTDLYREKASGGRAIDVRGTGGYIVAAPSIHPDTGQPYEWLSDPKTTPIADAPTWMIEDILTNAGRDNLIEAIEAAEAPATSGNLALDNRGERRREAWTNAVIDSVLKRVSTAPEGTRNNTLFQAAAQLGKLAHNQLVSADAMKSELSKAAQKCGLPDGQINKTLASGWGRGGTSKTPVIPNFSDRQKTVKKQGKVIDFRQDVDTETGEIISDPDALPSDFDLLAYRAEDGGILDVWRDHFGENWLYATGWEAWLYWSGTHWEKDKTGAICKQIQRVIATMHEQAKALLNKVAKDKTDLAKETDTVKKDKRAAQLASLEATLKPFLSATKRTSARVNSVETMARPHCAVSTEQLDGGNILNFQNGTLDLTTYDFRPHDRDDFQTYVIAYPYDATATAPRWETFMQEVLVKGTDDHTPDCDAISLFQELVGYSLTTETHHEKMAWMAGEGGNGKSVAVRTIRNLLGAKLAQSVDFQTLGTVGNYDLADLVGCRMIVSTESQRGGNIAEEQIKRLVSGEQIRTRSIYGKPFDLMPVCKVWWAMNDKPVIRGTDNSMWRRMALFTFHRSFDGPDKEPGIEPDTHLSETLTGELPGILNWALVGLRRLRSQGFTKSLTVEQATEEYRKESNPIALYLDERTVKIYGEWVYSKDLDKDYHLWCDQTGRKPLNSTNFGKELTRLKVERGRDGKGIKYQLALKATDYTEPMEGW